MEDRVNFDRVGEISWGFGDFLEVEVGKFSATGLMWSSGQFRGQSEAAGLEDPGRFAVERAFVGHVHLYVLTEHHVVRRVVEG